MSEIKPKHSVIGASSMSRWASCPGSVNLSKGLENKAGVAALEGTAAHEIVGLALERAFNSNISPQLVLKRAFDAISVYAAYIENLKKDNPIHIEHSFDMSKIFPGLYGTADAVIFEKDKRLLHVIDYKNGSGIPVEVKDNLQLQYYALGVLSTLPYNPIEIQMTIVQPRRHHPEGPIRSWKVNALHFIDFEADLIAAAKETRKKKAKIAPGKHCMFCLAKGKCPANHSDILKESKKDFFKYSDPKNDFKEVSFMPPDAHMAEDIFN